MQDTGCREQGRNSNAFSLPPASCILTLASTVRPWSFAPTLLQTATKSQPPLTPATTAATLPPTRYAQFQTRTQSRARSSRKRRGLRLHVGRDRRPLGRQPHRCVPGRRSDHERSLAPRLDRPENRRSRSREIDDSTRWLAQLEKLKASKAERNPSAQFAPRSIAAKPISPTSERTPALTGTMSKSPKKRGSTTTSSSSKSLAKASDEHIADRVTQEIGDNEHHLNVYTHRADRFRWIAPAAHRWLPDDAIRHAHGRAACSSSYARSLKACSASGMASPSRG